MSIDLSLYTNPHFYALIEHSTDAIALIAAEGTIIYASPSTERVIGYPASELVGMHSRTLLHPEDLESGRQQFIALLDRPGDSITIECRMRNPDGTWRWVEKTLTNRLADPAVEAVVCNYRDITDRIEGKERGRQNKERYGALVEQAGVGIFVVDLQGRFVEANELACQLSGYSREELLTRHIGDLTLQECLESLPARLENVSEEMKYSQWRLRRKDGSILPVDATAKRLSTGHLFMTVRDISDRIRAEEERARLLASEQAARAEAEARAAELSATFEAMTEAVAVYDTGVNMRYINPAYRSLMELDDDVNPVVIQFDKRYEWLAVRDLEGRPLPKEQMPALRMLRGERLSDTHTRDYLCRTFKGKELIVNASGAPIRGASGQIEGAVIVFRDVTRQHTLEQQLHYSEQKLRTLVESNILGIAVADLDGRIYETNEWFARLLGYSKDEMLSESFNWRQVVPPEIYGALGQVMEAIISTGALPPSRGEYVHKDGTRVPILASAMPLDRERRLILGVILDMSEQKAAERRKEKFLSMVSHELRTPLQSIMGFIELALLYSGLLPESLSSEAKNLIGEIERVLKRALGRVYIEARLVDELLDVSRLEMNRLELVVQRENLVTILQEIVANQQTAHRGRIELVLPPDELVPVMVDAGRIGQVLTDYLLNAFKYAPVDQVVSVHLAVEASRARVSVRDQGQGLTPEEQQQVWERFYQVAAPGLQGPEGGLGLGLAISKAIIEQHHGQVGVESTPGQGSTFWFTLPLADEQIQA